MLCRKALEHARDSWTRAQAPEVIQEPVSKVSFHSPGESLDSSRNSLDNEHVDGPLASTSGQGEYSQHKLLCFCAFIHEQNFWSVWERGMDILI